MLRWKARLLPPFLPLSCFRARTMEYDMAQAKVEDEEERGDSLTKTDEQRTRELFIKRVQADQLS